MKPMAPMKHMKAMEPMKPLEPLGETAPWWDESLGKPDSAGSQNEVAYAFFAEARQLLIRLRGRVMAYDTGNEHISGIAQSSDAEHPRFTSDAGVIDLNSLKAL